MLICFIVVGVINHLGNEFLLQLNLNSFLNLVLNGFYFLLVYLVCLSALFYLYYRRTREGLQLLSITFYKLLPKLHKSNLGKEN
jgi:hypothetical protein